MNDKEYHFVSHYFLYSACIIIFSTLLVSLFSLLCLYHYFLYSACRWQTNTWWRTLLSEVCGTMKWRTESSPMEAPSRYAWSVIFWLAFNKLTVNTAVIVISFCFLSNFTCERFPFIVILSEHNNMLTLPLISSIENYFIWNLQFYIHSLMTRVLKGRKKENANKIFLLICEWTQWQCTVHELLQTLIKMFIWKYVWVMTEKV